MYVSEQATSFTDEQIAPDKLQALWMNRLHSNFIHLWGMRRKRSDSFKLTHSDSKWHIVNYYRLCCSPGHFWTILALSAIALKWLERKHPNVVHFYISTDHHVCLHVSSFYILFNSCNVAYKKHPILLQCLHT